MEKYDIERYADAVFGFCLRRLNNMEDARDLSQEILCEAFAALKHTHIEHWEAWLWSIAQNRYCRFIQGKKRNFISLDGGAFEDIPSAEEEDLSEELQAAFAALHTLSARHREVMVDFYVKGLSCDAIAKARCLPPKTVRSRLFYGRDKLRKRWQIKMDENRIYTQLELFLSGNGDVDTSLLERQVVRAIVKACYQQFMTVDELSMATGIPSMYIEDELTHLLHSEILERKADKYRANIIIHRKGFAKEAEMLLLHHAKTLIDPLISVLENLMPSVRDIGFHGCDFPSTRLWWSLVPMLLREACTLAREHTPELIRGQFPPRRDGSRGWLCAYAEYDGVHRYFSGCNAYYLEESRFRYYWSSELYSESLNRLLRRLENEEIASPQISMQDEGLIAECIRCDLMHHTDNDLQWNIPILTDAQADALQAILRSAALPLAEALSPAVSALYSLMKMEIPQHLHDQIRGVFGIDFNSIISMICSELQSRGILQQPSSGCYAGQVVMLLENGV